ncbi:MAG: c-type cytochrome [Ketobacteraceae bacterium]|nr:c-type cytochrome [Ketobacteraceae bacterium]
MVSAMFKALAASVAGAFLRLRSGMIAGTTVALLAGCGQSGVDLDSPAAVYDNYCFACHDTGAAGAPTLEQSEFWKLAANEETRLYRNTLKGIRAMPRKGTCLACSDEQLKQTVDWMVERATTQVPR